MTLTAEPPVAPAAQLPVAPAAELLAAAATGDRVATRRVGALVAAPVSRYCRARLGRSPLADEVAREVVATVLAALGRTTDVPAFHALVYRAASDRVGRVAAGLTRAPSAAAPGLPAFLGDLAPRRREVLVLRVAVGLSVEQTAWALGTTPGDVRIAQHAALESLRTAGVST